MSTELILLLASGIFIVIGAKLWQKGNHLLATGKKAKAIIFKNNFKSSESDGMYYPVVRFLTDRQEWITQELSIGCSPAKPEGTKLDVIYDPDNPTTVEINSPFQLEILPRLFVSIGLIGFTMGVLAYLNIIQFIAD
jgi:hypothetical protein